MTPRIEVIGVVVADMARALAFYRRLGIEISADADTEPHVEVSLPGGLKLAFDTSETIRSFDPGWTGETGGRGIALAFACDGPAEVDATYAGLVDAGYEGHLEPWDAFWGQRYAAVNDPDGHTVDFFAPLSS